MDGNPNERRVKIQEAAGTRPFGCLLVHRDIAFAALYFASDESEWITGSLLIWNITLSELPSIADYQDCTAFLKAARSDVWNPGSISIRMRERNAEVLTCGNHSLGGVVVHSEGHDFLQ